jgi:hypothetical protein
MWMPQAMPMRAMATAARKLKDDAFMMKFPPRVE